MSGSIWSAAVSCARPRHRRRLLAETAARRAGMGAGALGWRGFASTSASPRTRWASAPRGLREWIAYSPTVREAFGLKERERIAGFIYFGHPMEKPDERERPEVEALVERWPQPERGDERQHTLTFR